MTAQLEAIERRQNYNYKPIDVYLESLVRLDLPVEDLATHLREHLSAQHITPNGVSLKAITVVTQLIRDKGGNPDELLEQVSKPRPVREDLDSFVEGLLRLGKESSKSEK